MSRGVPTITRRPKFRIVNSPAAVGAILGNSAAVAAILTNTAALQAIVNSAAATQALLANPAARQAIANNPTALAAVLANSTASAAIAANPTVSALLTAADGGGTVSLTANTPYLVAITTTGSNFEASGFQVKNEVDGYNYNAYTSNGGSSWSSGFSLTEYNPAIGVY